uniref:Transposable element P transposase-like RNase H domain-containing protein n=1 Tax=Phlebotomus papatasi TaxID=29031 RepID=A0A1B0DA93_PHLPP
MAAQFEYPKDKVTVLSFDEVKISGDMVYDPSSDRVIGPHQNAQVIMARGLFANWKQPIYYDFDQNMSPEILFSAIKKVENEGFHVVSITHDLSGANRGLWRDLQLSENCTSFKVPESGNEIFVFTSFTSQCSY